MKNILFIIFFIITHQCIAQNAINNRIKLSKGQIITANTSYITESITDSRANANLFTTTLLKVIDSTDSSYRLMTKLLKAETTEIGDASNKVSADSTFPEKLVTVNSSTGKLITDKSLQINVKRNSWESNAVDELLGESVMQDAFLIIPFGKVVGDSWLVLDTAANISSSTTYTLVSCIGNLYKIAFKGTSIQTMDLQIRGMETNTKMNNTFSGELELDKYTSLTKKKISNTLVKAKIEINGQFYDMDSNRLTTTTFNY